MVPSTRLVSLDAYRGFIMLAMASAGFRLAQVAKEARFQSDPVWQFLGYHTDHVAWRGCAFWDLIQPSFMFMVGVAMAYSYTVRQARGQSYGSMLAHAVYRSLVLVLLGVFLTSNWSTHTNWQFTNVLCQIGLGYTFLFLLWNRPAWLQLAAAAAILVADWGLFYVWPTPPANFDYAKVGVPADWPHLTGLEAHWDKSTNIAAAADRVILNWFPREKIADTDPAEFKRFEFNEGGYATLNFIPSLATMIFGLVAGGLMRSNFSPVKKLLTLVAWGGAFLAAGWALDHFGICPSVKRIWTPGWAIYSTGWTLWMLAAFFALIDMTGWQRLAWPLVVVGVNSIAMYCMSQLIGGWVANTLERHFGPEVFTAYGQLDAVYAPISRMVLVLLVFWLICVWLYRQRVFIRI
jgi:heparan-alpha-glucosaminide N-acetyltransferase